MQQTQSSAGHKSVYFDETFWRRFLIFNFWWEFIQIIEYCLPILYHIEILSITRMITERTGVHSILLPLLIVPIESKTALFVWIRYIAKGFNLSDNIYIYIQS